MFLCVGTAFPARMHEIEDGACVCDGVKNVCMLWLFPLGPEEALPIGAPITLVLERREDRTTTVTVGVIAVLSPRVYRCMHKNIKNIFPSATEVDPDRC